MVTLAAGEAPEVEFQALAPVRWETLEPGGLDAARNLADVHAAVTAAFDGRRGGAPPDQEWILRVDLRGACPLAPLLASADERTELAAQLREDLGVLDVEVRDRGLHRPLDLKSYRDQPHLLGQTLELLGRAATDDAALDSISPTQLAGGDGGDEVGRCEYLRELLEGLDTAAGERLLRELGDLMRIDGWEIDAFGPISGWTEHGLAEHGVVVVAGDNETGKSALFEFLTTALFGFAPAAAANHPYRPWDGRFPGGALLANLDDRTNRAHRPPAHVAARRGRLEIDGQLQGLANRPVTWVGGLARAVFTNLHAVTQNEALGMDSRTWQSVEDRMLGGSSFDFLRPAREVVQQLHQDRQNLWRPDRRGRPKAVEIRERRERVARGAATGQRTPRRRSKPSAGSSGRDSRTLGGNRTRTARAANTIKVMLARDAALAPIVRQGPSRG